MTFDVRVRRVSDSLTGKPEHLRADSVDYSASLSEVSALRLQLSQHGKVNGALRAGEELALEIWDGTKWTEGEQSRFTSLGLSLDELDPTMATQLDVVEYVSFRLSKALHDVQSDRTFTDVTPGYIVHTLLTEAKSRGAVEGVTWTFTATHDSTGAAWPKAVTIDLPPDQSALDTLGVLVDTGHIDWTTRGRELVLYLKENAGRRHPFTVGKRALERPFRSSLTDAATAVTVRLDDGKFIRKAGNTSIGLGVLERAISASGVTDDATANVLLDAELAAGAPKSELTISENAETLDRVPLVNYDLGDWVWVRRGGAGENVRVSGVQVRKTKGESPTIDIILMDKIADNAARLAKAAKAMGRVGGNGRFKGSGGGGGGGVSVRYGTVHPAYISYSGSPARVSFDNGATYSDPLDFISEHPPFAGDRVAVVGNLIVGRIAAEPGEVPGSIEILEPAAGWREYDPARYGPFSIRKTASEWVILNGVLERDPAVPLTDERIAVYIPGAYRPARSGANSWSSYRDEKSLIPYGAIFTTTTGAIRNVDGSINTISLSGLAWNTQTHSLWNVNNLARGGVGSEGTAFFIGSATSGNVTLPSTELAPSRTQGFHLGSSVHGTLDASTRLLSVNATSTPHWDSIHWQPNSSKQYEYKPLTPMNGYTWNPADPFEYARTPSGIVRLRGRPGGGGVTGATAAILPPGYRPSYEVILPNGLRITPSGAVSNVSTYPNTRTGSSQVSSQGAGAFSFVTAFIAGR
ncbi:hypothetical protein [uncultured Microbacterium sp.]|uniref:hypothetical protein n=1 Tax=uncultured Microbacterium sp. TaxID=191216 RepID=UPI0028DCC8EE|nr:hypothetical protein [uncultured Microbacterium sp.]